MKTVTTKVCKWPDCNNTKVVARGFCDKDYRRSKAVWHVEEPWLAWAERQDRERVYQFPCQWTDCCMNQFARGYCRTHWRRVTDLGWPEDPECEWEKKHPTTPEGMKWCRGCARSLPEDDFFANGTRPDGSIRLNSQCKTCKTASVNSYRANNRDVIRVSRYRRSKRLREAFVEKVMLSQLIERDGIDCIWCGTLLNLNDDKAFHVDHIMPLAKDGLHCLENLGLSCVSCNTSKGSKKPAGFIAYRLRKGLEVNLAQHVLDVLNLLSADTPCRLLQKIDGEIKHPKVFSLAA